ncbi:3'-5' exonuclease [archaeon]|nr:3'-5' exonuclease [archaeon]NCP79289.1 3'-5' exonuclease [archaeon]NCP98252.1 3'-5' exonuclease [archaeon]NCQ07056.1 3'-5' exonuclease [archaeon]NCQ50852.1 3'-5' exonuclease [archaeon]
MLGRYIVLDIETTGLNRSKDQITEIAALKLEGNRIVDKFETLINPQMKIPAEITQLTGITDDMVKEKPTIQEVLPNFIDFIKKDILVAHNAIFDIGFINHNLNLHLNQTLENKNICTMNLAKKIISTMPSYRLSSLCNYFDIKNEYAHRAMSDVYATTKLFTKFQAIMHNNGLREDQDILKFYQDPLLKLNLSLTHLI